MPGCAVTMLSTDDAPEAWARAIVEGRRAHDPADHELVKAAGFDRVTTIEQLGKLYRGDSD
jgi:hypothetical protein